MVNKARSHDDQKVVNLSKEIVQKWKNDVKRPASAAVKSAALHAGSSSTSAGLKSPTKSATPTPAPTGSTQKATGDLSKRNKDVDGVHWKVTGNDQRDRSVGLLYDGLAFNNDMGTVSRFSMLTVILTNLSSLRADHPRHRSRESHPYHYQGRRRRLQVQSALDLPQSQEQAKHLSPEACLLGRDFSRTPSIHDRC